MTLRVKKSVARSLIWDEARFDATALKTLWGSVLLSSLILAACTAVGYSMRGMLLSADMVAVYLIGTITIAVWLGYWPAVFYSVMSVLCFDYFFVEPIFSFMPQDPSYWLIFTVMLFVFYGASFYFSDKSKRSYTEWAVNGLFYTKNIASLYGYRKALHFLVYTHHSKSFIRWFDYLDMQLPKHISKSVKTQLAMRPAHRFIRHHLMLPHKMSIIAYHYAALKSRFCFWGLKSFMNPQGNRMAELTGRSGRKYVVMLQTEVSKEGMLRLCLIDTHLGIALASLLGILGVDKEGRPVFWIGSLQGPRPPEGKEEITYATKDLNNLRPKQAVFYAACVLAEWFGIEAMLAPSLDNLVSIKRFYKNRKIYHDYNSFWEEFTNDKIGKDYRISLPLQRRQISEVSSKRRKDWLLRYKRIDAMSLSIKEALNSFR